VEDIMKRLDLDVPTFGFIVITRAAIGVGIGLLAASRIPEAERRKIGVALLSLGAATTVPALIALRRARQRADVSEMFA
jgi:hypothetical protein